MADKKTNALAQVDAATLAVYPILNPEEQSLALQCVQENLGANGIAISDLDKVTVPPGGGTTFEIPTIDGETEPSKTIEGIIVLADEKKANWAKTLEDDPNAAPNCYSNDCVTGYGDPMETGTLAQHSCALCPKNVWGSDLKGGKGKACKDMRPLYLLMEGSYIPLIVQVPKKSLRHIRKYLTRLSGKGIPFYGCITRFALYKVAGAGTPDYSELVPSLVSLVPKAQWSTIKAYQDSLKLKTSEPPTAAEAVHAATADEYDPFKEEQGSGIDRTIEPENITQPDTTFEEEAPTTEE